MELENKEAIFFMCNRLDGSRGARRLDFGQRLSNKLVALLFFNVRHEAAP